MDKSIWEKTIRKNTNKKGVESHDRNKGGICAEKGEGVPIVKKRK